MGPPRKGHVNMSTAQATPASNPLPSGVPSLFGHPIGLFVLFFTEMWERFSYYGMRGLLKLYMVNYLFVTSRQVLQGGKEMISGDPYDVFGWRWFESLLPIDVQGQASVIYGWYTGLVYLTPVLGGWLADRYWGQRKTVVLGGILMALGHFVLAFESWFFIGLLLLICGNGAFKPNVSTQVGNLYAANDPRRDGAFTIFYMGINLGAFFSNLVCGTLGAVYGWHYGFGAAGIGMVLGLIIYLAGQRYLAPEVRNNQTSLNNKHTVENTDNHNGLSHEERSRIGALLVLCMLNIIFWAVYEQQGNTMQTWADENTIWPTIMGFTIPSTWFQSFNPFFIFALAPLLDIYWRYQARNNKEPSSVSKMAIGCFILGLSFIFMSFGASIVGTGKGSLLWPVLCILMLTVGELYLSPIGLSLVTKVSPARMVSLMMGMWFLSSFFGNILSGYIGALYSLMTKESFFALLTGLSLAAGTSILLMAKPLKKAMGQTSRI